MMWRERFVSCIYFFAGPEDAGEGTWHRTNASSILYIL